MKALILVILGLLAFVVNVSAMPLTIVQTIGGDEGDVFLHNPAWPVYADDGTLYLLNAGDCQVLHLSPGWEQLNAFGKCGEGPGEFADPTGLALYKDQVWVFETARITVYELDGTYVRTILPGNQYAGAVVLDGRLMVRLGAGERVAAILDDDGKIVEAFGLECPENFFEGFKKCRNMQILAHDDGRCLFLNLVDGQAYLIGDDGHAVWDLNLVEKEDDSTMTKSDDGESINLTLTLAMGMGLRDSRGYYWINKIPEDQDQRSGLEILSSDLKTTLASFDLPDGVHAWQLAETPTGQILLVSTSESTIYVCDLDETGIH